MKKIVIIASLIIVACYGCLTSENVANRFSEEEIEAVDISSSKTFSSKGKQAEIINLNAGFGVDLVCEDGMLDTLYFLPLETTQQSLFNGITKIIVCDNRIFIRDDDDRVLIFDNKGRFIKKIPKGQGPGEITKLRDIAYDQSSKQFIVVHSDFIVFYDNNGVYISDMHVPFLFDEICATNWGYAFYQPVYINYHLGLEAKYVVYICNKDFKITGKGIDLIPFKYVTNKPYMQNHDNNVVLAPVMNDTIFTITSTSIKPRYILDYKSYKVDFKDEERMKVSDKYYQCSGFIENSTTQVFNFYSPQKGGYTIIRDKRTNVLKGTKNSYSQKEPGGCFSPLATYRDYFVNYWTPYKNHTFDSPAISQADIKKIANLTEDDNPVLMFYKLKELR